MREHNAIPDHAKGAWAKVEESRREPSDSLKEQWDALVILAERWRDTVHAKAEHIGITTAAMVDLMDAVVDIDIDDVPAFLASRGLNIDAFVEGVASMVEGANPFDYLASDDSLYREPVAPFDPTEHRPRRSTGRGTEVTGRRNGHVIGDLHGAYVTMTYDSVYSLTQSMFGADIDALIGTDTYSWEQVVHHKPDVWRVDGSTVYLAPEGAGASTVNGGAWRNPSTRHNARKPVRFPGTRATYNGRAMWRVEGKNGKTRTVSIGLKVPKAERITYMGAWPFFDVRVIKLYRTTANGRYVIGHGKWVDSPSTVKRAKAATAKTRRPRVPAVDVDAIDIDVITSMVAAMASAFTRGTPSTVKVKDPEGTTVTMSNDPEHRRYRVIFDGSNGRSMSTTRHLHSLAKYLASKIGYDPLLAAAMCMATVDPAKVERPKVTASTRTVK